MRSSVCNTAVFGWYRKAPRICALRRRRIAQETKGLVAVGRDDDVVEALGPGTRDVELDLVLVAHDLLDRRCGAQPRSQRSNDRIHISSGTAGDGAPLQRAS